MSAVPSGQVAYEAAVRAMLGEDVAATDDGPAFAWDAIGSIEREAWEAAARAVVMSTPLYAELARQLAAATAALRDILEANPDAPAGAYAIGRARLALGADYDAARESHTAPGRRERAGMEGL